MISRKLSLQTVDKICLFNQNDKTCKYLGITEREFVCTKHSVYSEILNKIDFDKTSFAQGNNCDGYGSAN